jgi:hypothetical protein
MSTPTRKHEPYCHLLAYAEGRLAELAHTVEQLHRQQPEGDTADTTEAGKCVTQARDDVHNAVRCLQEALLFLDRDAGRRSEDFTPLV